MSDADADPTPRPFFDLANVLSLSRVPLAAVPWLAPRDTTLLFVCLVVAAVTDWADGWAARRAAGGEEPGGAGVWLDPLCDKVFVASVVVLVFATHPDHLWLLPLLLVREIAQAALLGFYEWTRLRPWVKFDFTAGKLGKATTVAQFVFVGAVAVERPWVVELAWLSFALGAGSVVVYVQRAFHALHHPSGPRPR